MTQTGRAARSRIARSFVQLPERFGTVLFAVTAGLLLVEAATVVTAALVTNNAATEAARASSIALLFNQANLQLGVEQALVLQQPSSGTADPSARLAQASAAVDTTLSSIIKQGSAADRANASTVRVLHAQYSTAALDILQMEAIGDAQVMALDAQRLGPLMAQLNARLATAASAEVQETDADLARLSGIQRARLAMMPALVLIDIVLIAAMWLLQDAHRRARATRADFLASMSHELRTPLNSILGFAQLLEMGRGSPLDERQARQVANIRTSGDTLLGLINDLLDLSKIDAGKMPMTIEAVDLWSVLTDVVQQVAPIATQRSTEIRLAPAGSLEVRADRLRLGQIIRNGLSNALKFSPAGGVVEVTAERVRSEVRLVIADSGPGVPREDLERVFEEFEQVAGTRDRNAEGTGLGLPISRRLAREMGGDVWLQSAPGAGTCFMVRLAAARQEAVGAQTAQPVTAA